MHTKHHKWQGFALIGVLVAIMIGIIAVFTLAIRPFSSIRDQAERIATKSAHVTNIDGFWWNTRDKSYLTVSGQRNGKPVYVVIAKKTGKVNVVTQATGTTRNQILRKVWGNLNPKRVMNVALRKTGKTTYVWDVGFESKNGHLGYATYSYRNGTLSKLIRDL